MHPVVVLFVRADSIYKTLPGVECYDEARDARTWPGGCPVVAHPPCRTWGTNSLWYPTLEALCEANGLTLGLHYDNQHGEYWRALPNAELRRSERQDGVGE